MRLARASLRRPIAAVTGRKTYLVFLLFPAAKNSFIPETVLLRGAETVGFTTIEAP